jgi:hypothetical protein
MEDVDPVRCEVVEDPAIVGDEEDAHPPLPPLHHPVDPLGDCAQGVDVQTGVRFVEDGHAGLEHRQLEDLGALLFPA